MSLEMMRAVRFHQFGSPEVLGIDTIPRLPSPGAGHVLVRVHTAGVNPVDAAMRAGFLQSRAPITLPAIPGVELSGTVEEIGTDITTYGIGQAIYSNTIANLGNGSHAEYVLLPVHTIASMPCNLDFEQAASVPHGARTAWSGLFEYGDLQPDQSILVQGGAGGVGMYVVQLAHLKGAHVIATTSTGNVEFVQELGADEVVDYTQIKAEDVIHDVDMVYDCVGGEVMERSWQTLKKGGVLISAVGFPAEETAFQYGVRSGRVMMPMDLPFILKQITELIEAGKLKPHVRKIFPIEQVAQAHTLCETRHGRGRIVLRIAD